MSLAPWETSDSFFNESLDFLDFFPYPWTRFLAFGNMSISLGRINPEFFKHEHFKVSDSYVDFNPTVIAKMQAMFVDDTVKFHHNSESLKPVGHFFHAYLLIKSKG